MTPEDDDLTYFQVTCLVCAHIWSTQRPAMCWALMTNRSYFQFGAAFVAFGR